MSENVIQASFASGELSPSLFARVDITKYHSGAARMRNFFVDYRSGASTRPGTEFIRPTQQFTGPIRLVRFQQSVTVTYVLEFGNFYLRFISQGASVVEPATSISTITKASTATVTAPGHSLSNGQLVFITGAVGMPQVNNQYYIVNNVVAGSSFQIFNGITGGPMNSTNWGVYTGGAVVERVYTIGTPYASSELAMLKFSQRAGQMNITHPNHPPYLLTLFSATNWTLVPATIGSTANPPTISGVTASGTGPAFSLYEVTTLDVNNQESGPSNQGAAYGVIDLRVTSGTIQVTWTGPSSGTAPFGYNVYKTDPSLIGPLTGFEQFGFIGTVQAGVFIDSNISPDFSATPPIHQNPFAGINPAVSGYFQQRLVYANGGGVDVDRFWMSKPGAYYNFDKSNPSEPDDSVDAKLVSLEVNEIKSMIPMPSGLVFLTTKGAWQVSGGAGGVATQGGPISPSTLTATAQAYIGASDVPPILINYDILFVQQKGSIVRDLAYNIYANIYTGNDISIMSNHLFYGHQILEWAYAEEPFKIVWAVRDDGVLLSLTILKEQDLYGWARHDTYGNFKSVCTVTEGSVDATYVVVDRPVAASGGAVNFYRMIERLSERTFPFGAEDAWCVDAGVKTPEFVITYASLFGTAPSTNTPGGTIELVTDFANLFVPGHVGWVIRYAGGVMKITQWINGQVVIATISRPITNFIPDDPFGRPNVAHPGEWSFTFPFNVIYGLSHLEGQKVSVLADGGVVNGMTVVDGSVTLPALVTKAVVGYGFQAQLQTMYLDLGQEMNTIQGKRKKIGALTVRVKDSRGVKAGRTFNTVIPIKELNRTTLMGLPIDLITADERIVMDPLWDVPGQVCIQVDDPLPATILGVIPEIVLGDTAK